jgi:uncharacterized protein
MKQWKKSGLLALAVIGAAILVVGCQGIAAASPPAQNSNGGFPTNTISVSGTGTAYGQPEQATVMLGVSTTNADVSAAVEASNGTTQAIIDALKGLGIDEKDIQTINFSVWPEDRYDNNGQPTGERVYHVDSMVQVTVRDLGKVGEVIDGGLGAGANTVAGLSFSLQNSGALESDARTKALDDARAKAQEIADALGVSLGDAIIVSETPIYGGGPVYGFDTAEGRGGAGAPPISPGEQSVGVTLNVTFAINR